MREPTIDIAGAARATGLSVKAVRGRVERGSLPYELVAGRRRIPVRALLDAGLLVDSKPEPALEGEDVVRELRALRAAVERLETEVARLRDAR